MKNAIITALLSCRFYVLSIFFVYVISCTTGILMVHTGSEFALTQRDKIVGAALHADNAALNYRSGNKLTAALYDFGSNLFLAAIPQTVLGLAIVPPYFTTAYQGWVGGIVSVNGAHQSRFTHFKSGAYYVVVLLLQIAAFSLSIGAGVKCGVETYKYNTDVGWKFWKFRIPKESIIDVGYVYLVSVPIFLIASCFEFLSTWNM